MAKTHQLTQAAYDRLAAELEDLRTRGRIELADRIERARELGDLKENAEYHAAKEEKAKMEARVAQLFGIIENAEIVTIDGESDGTVRAGSVVHLRYEGDDDDEIEIFYLGSIEEQHPHHPVISTSSPLGEALLGAEVDAVVSYEAPNGQLSVIVVHVE